MPARGFRNFVFLRGGGCLTFRGGLSWKGDSEIFSLYSHIFLRKISKLLPKNLMKLTFEMKLFEYIAYNPSNYSRYGLNIKFEGRKQVFSIRLPCVFGVFRPLADFSVPYFEEHCITCN